MECLDLCIHLAETLEFLHRQQLIHRDIKPSNIIFVNGVAKFADIGLVTDVATKGRDVTYLGTPGRIAPEGPGSPGRARARLRSARRRPRPRLPGVGAALLGGQICQAPRTSNGSSSQPRRLISEPARRRVALYSFPSEEEANAYRHSEVRGRRGHHRGGSACSEEFGPLLREPPGFQGYYVVDAGDGILATISVFDSEEAAADSITAAAGWVQENVAHLIPNALQVTSGITAGVSAEVHA
jgi:serine/threonine protein kinase